MKKRTTYIFTLKNIDIHDVLVKNNYIQIAPEQVIIEDDPIICDDQDEDNHVTNLSDLMHEKSNRYITIVDPSKNHIKMWISMIDFTKAVFLPISTNKPCWWCRGQFATSPIGCPVRYYSNHISERKKDRIQQKLQSINLPSDTTDFFETEGIFCSFPCCKAYILSKQHRSKYNESCTLLTLMYQKLFGYIQIIKHAGSVHTIDIWGGHLTLQEFRDSFCQLTYNTTPNEERPFMCIRPYMCATGTYIEETKVIT